MKEKTNKEKTHMSYRTLADMHGDGVYFNEKLLAQKKEKGMENKKNKEDN